MNSESRKVTTIHIKARDRGRKILVEHRILYPSLVDPTIAILSDPIKVEAFIVEVGRRRSKY